MRVILGDNPFFGVNHRTGSKMLDSAERRFGSAAQVMVTAQKGGVRTLMLSTHPGYEDLLVAAGCALPTGHGFEIAPVIPYPHTLNNSIAQDGYLGLIKKLGVGNLASVGLDIVHFMGFFGAREGAKLEKAFRLAISMEVDKIRALGFVVRHACLHNIITDLLLALDRFDILQGFIDACKRDGLQAVLITQNAVAVLSANLGGEFVSCFSFNCFGYMVNPSLDKVVNAIKSPRKFGCELWAMQILAGGAVRSEVALRDENLRFFDAVLYATTKPHRVEEFLGELKCLNIGAENPG